MDQRKYLNAIRRKLRCSAAKKKEIVKQLRADIDAALEKGETLEHILDAIGRCCGGIQCRHNGKG